MTSDVLVIGGGPAGMFAAITAAKNGANVVLLERNDRLGKKLLITGKGRCNVTNDCTAEEVLQNTPRNGRFLYSAMTAFPPEKTKAFFEGLPNDLFESARIDGAGEFKVLFRIVLPLSLPIVTTISLYYAVAHWNVYTAAILYIQDTKLMPLQVILRRMINSASTGDLNIDDEIPPETLRMAAVCIATAPIVIIYPFIQKYFVQGTLAGAVKG